MGDLTATQMTAELQRRVTQINATDALAAIQRAIRWINRQGSFTFQLQSASQAMTVAATTGISALPTSMDVGKAHLILNANGTPVRRVGVQDAWMSGNYNLPADKGFDCYFITQTSLRFIPPQTVPTDVLVFYHVVTADISGSNKSNLPRDFDDLVVDLAEAEERRISDVGDTWPAILARCQDQIKTMLDGYRSVTMEPMPTTEAAQVATEKTQIGRS